MTPTPRQTKTAAELMAELEQDDAYHARRQELDEEQQFRREEYRDAAEDILAELRALGFEVESIGELRHASLEYRAAVPVLLRWLPQVSDRSVKEDIIRTLSVPWARPSTPPVLIDEFRRTQDDMDTGLRWTIGNALSVVADDDVFDDIVTRARDRRHGRSREMVVLALANMRDSRAVDVLLELLDDDEVAGHAVMALGKLKADKTRPVIEKFLKHSKPWVRKDARKALSKFDC